jgi:hypothetical protein
MPVVVLLIEEFPTKRQETFVQPESPTLYCIAVAPLANDPKTGKICWKVNPVELVVDDGLFGTVNESSLVDHVIKRASEPVYPLFKSIS